MFFRIISQKLKQLISYFKRLLRNKKTETKGLKREEQTKSLPVYPLRVPLDCGNIICAAEYALKSIKTPAQNQGIGIVAKELGNISGLNSVMNYACMNFKYVTVYTDDKAHADALSDLIYDKYGLPVMILGAAEADGCGYPMVMDFDRGRLKYGRRRFINGALISADGAVEGLCIDDSSVSLV
ncbi:MAG TPA: hypothetical protein H9900_04040 [Candidatus Monoglobus merdigallinarum]|uniref:Uncharacterized protein n=1 Tax=Candidatus Monoglobus merdigallinarum TaxID=2838698 RepID=A0A9D1PRL9_9FIRM|nr:hypothetical protein [Candidatus Monoglobus merdigallinarum]